MIWIRVGPWGIEIRVGMGCCCGVLAVQDLKGKERVGEEI